MTKNTQFHLHATVMQNISVNFMSSYVFCIFWAEGKREKRGQREVSMGRRLSCDVLSLCHEKCTLDSHNDLLLVVAIVLQHCLKGQSSICSSSQNCTSLLWLLFHLCHLKIYTDTAISINAEVHCTVSLLSCAMFSKCAKWAECVVQAPAQAADAATVVLVEAHDVAVGSPVCVRACECVSWFVVFKRVLWQNILKNEARAFNSGFDFRLHD